MKPSNLLTPNKAMVLASILAISKAPSAQGGSWQVPFVGLLLFLLIHASSLWSRKVHKSNSLILFEAAVYYATLQALCLVLAERFLFLGHEEWVLAHYFALYFAFRVLSISGDNATLSPGCLTLVLSLFCLSCPLFYLLSQDAVAEAALLLQHCMTGWILSEACDYCFWGAITYVLGI